MVQWESEACRAKVRETIPVTDLYKRASDLYNDLTEEFKADDKNTKADYLKHSLLIVLRWFYTHFFYWNSNYQMFRWIVRRIKLFGNMTFFSDWFKNEFFKWRDGHFTRHNDPLILLGNFYYFKINPTLYFWRYKRGTLWRMGELFWSDSKIFWFSS